MDKKYIISLFLALGFLAVFAFFPIEKSSQLLQKPTIKQSWPQPEIEAEAAMAQNLVTGKILFSKNSDIALPLASLTKIVTLLVVLDHNNLDEPVLISKDAIAIPEPSSLRAGEYLKVRDLAAMAMVESSNDAVYALFEHTYKKNRILPEYAEGWFLNLMREKAKSMGTHSMNFENVTGLDISLTIPGAYGSTEDILRLAKINIASRLWQFGSVREVVSSKDIRHILKLTNMLDSDLTSLVGAKTGYTDLAGGNLLIIVEYPLGNPIGIVVLGSSENGRFEDVKKILSWIKITQ